MLTTQNTWWDRRFVGRVDCWQSQICRVNSWLSVREGVSHPLTPPVAPPLIVFSEFHLIRFKLLHKTKPVAKPAFQGWWQNCLRTITWYKIWESISYSTLCYNNQTDTVRAGKDWTFQYVIKIKVEVMQNLRLSLISCKVAATIKNWNKFPGVAKSWHPVAHGWHLPPPCHPMAIGLHKNI